MCVRFTFFHRAKFSAMCVFLKTNIVAMNTLITLFHRTLILDRVVAGDREQRTHCKVKRVSLFSLAHEQLMSMRTLCPLLSAYTMPF